MSVSNQFGTETTIKRDIEAAYDDGSDDVPEAMDAATTDSPLCIVDQ